MGGSEANGQAIHRQDHWSKPVFVMSSMLCLFLLLQAFFHDKLAEHALIILVLGAPLSIIFGLCFLGYGSLAAVAFLLTKQPRKAMSHLLAVGALVLTVLGLPTVATASRELRFLSLRPHYESLISEKRAHSPGSTPVRLILEQRDLSLFATATDLESIVYDETDETLNDPCPVLEREQCPVTLTGFAKSGPMSLSVERIEGHFYRITES